MLASSGQTVVLTNGCFDLLHPGHIHTINESARLGDVLVVAVNSDASIRRIKGAGRPIEPLSLRIEKLSNLDAIDFIVVFQRDTPLSLIEELSPDVLAKGGDYTIDEIVGSSTVAAQGGIVTTIPYLEGYSTSDQVSSKQRS